MTEFIPGARADNPLHLFAYPDVDNLWWRADAWNEDTLEWLARRDDIQKFEDHLEAIELEVCGYYASTMFPQMAMTGDQLASYFELVGEQSITRNSISYNPTGFVYDPASPVSRPIQLVDYYMELEKGSVRDDRLFGSGYGARIDVLLTVSPLTVEDWDRIYEASGAIEDFNAEGNVLDIFATNPGLHRLPPRPALSNLSPVDYIHSLVMENLDNIKSRFAAGEADELLQTNTTGNVFTNVERWVSGLNPQSHHLAEMQAKLDELAVTFAEVLPPFEGVNQLADNSVIGKLLATMNGILRHPNFTSEADTPGRNELLARGDDEARARLEEYNYIPYFTLDPAVTNPATASRIGLPPVDGKEYNYDFATQTIHKMSALLTYTPEQGEEVFRRFVLEGHHPTWSLAASFAPMFGRFFRELREQYGDYERTIPLEWILEAATDPVMVD